MRIVQSSFLPEFLPSFICKHHPILILRFFYYYMYFFTFLNLEYEIFIIIVPAFYKIYYL